MSSTILHAPGLTPTSPEDDEPEEKNPFLVGLGERVRALRSRRGMTRKAVANTALNSTLEELRGKPLKDLLLYAPDTPEKPGVERSVLLECYDADGTAVELPMDLAVDPDSGALLEALPEIDGQGFFELLTRVVETNEALVFTDQPVQLLELVLGERFRREQVERAC